MNAPNTEEAMALVDVAPQQHRPLSPLASTALAETSPAAIMLNMMDRGASLDTIERMMDLQDRWAKNEALKAYNVAFAAFKADAVRILRAKTISDGPLKNKSYAELHTVVDAVTPALSRQGLSASWKLTKDDKDWIEVTCVLKHAQGHSESVSMGGPPDAGGAKNQIQARASTISYLERYTLKAICGVAEGGDDNDGGDGAPAAPAAPVAKPTYDQAAFEKNLPVWRDLVSSGKKSADQVIATVESKGAAMTDAQRTAIRQAQGVAA